MASAKPAKQTLNTAESWWAVAATRDDRSAASLLQTESAGGRHQRSVYELFSEMEEKDGHLYSVLQTRLNGLLGLRRRLIPAAPASEPARQAAFQVSQALDAFPRFDEFLRVLLDGIGKGFSAVELVWDYDVAGRLAVVDWIAHPQEWFAFGDDGGLLLLSPPFRAPGAANHPVTPLPGRATTAIQNGFAPPPRKFVVLRFGHDHRNPYGRGLLQRAYWLYWFKKNTLKFWAIYNEKYGAPTAVASYAPGTSPDDRRRLREVLDSLQTDSSVVVPDSVDLRLLEQARGGSGDSYRDFLDWCNDEISKVVLGATLTSSEGRRSGSLALGQVHQSVRQDYIDADARLLERTLNDTLVRWIVELNSAGDVPMPRIQIETESPGDLAQRVAVDRELLALGVALPVSYFYERYGRPAPTAEEAPLRYDDANFYQYHLQFGVLTINEVRARLNLAPVAWGDGRTADPRADLPTVARSAEDVGRKPV